ncbi:MAG TPA: hypothetical protein VN700_06000 [Vicinamibacterales bacterium]|nr:hypothetical protein [Vicinamibacterales bacterium]
MTAVFFISGHGFGHASREVEVIKALAKIRPDIRIVVRSAVSPALLARTLTVPYELRPGACDAAIAQPSSITQDDEATVREAVGFYREFDARVEAETRILGQDGVALIVGDIPPLAFEVARRLGVPSAAIANFTWDWIFETHPGLTEAAPWLVPRLRAAYRQATLALELPFPGGFEVFPVVRRIPLVARRHTRDPVDTRQRFGVPASRPAALLSFGGYGLPNLDLAAVDMLKAGWTVVTTDRSSGRAATPPGVVFVPETDFIDTGFRYEDLVAAVDVVVTKPGYGIISECISAARPMLYTSRGQFREYEVLVNEMPKYIRCRLIEQPALMSGAWQESIDALLAQPPAPDTLALDGAEIAARAISDLLDASTSG